MLLNNLHLINSNQTVNIAIEDKLIKAVSPERMSADTTTLNFNGALAFPGLINSHDHLDFNLFPQFGCRLYNNYTEWGAYIHLHYKHQIKKVLQVPLELRTAWGVYKNLLAGVTTVVNHGDKLPVDNNLISVVQNYHCLHSVQFEKLWKVKLNVPFKSRIPYVIHSGEGSDRSSNREIDSLLRWNLLKHNLIGVHGVAMEPKQAERFKALVWCPQSNYFLLDKTAEIRELKKHTNILFGTDSTLTSHWNIWEHLRLASDTLELSPAELLNSLTTTPAETWQLNSGKLAENKDADIVIAKARKNVYPISRLYDLNPEDLLMVIRHGKIIMFDTGIYRQLEKQLFPVSQFDKVKMGFAYKYVAGDVIELMDNIKNYYPEARFPITAA